MGPEDNAAVMKKRSEMREKATAALGDAFLLYLAWQRMWGDDGDLETFIDWARDETAEALATRGTKTANRGGE